MNNKTNERYVEERDDDGTASRVTLWVLRHWYRAPYDGRVRLCFYYQNLYYFIFKPALSNSDFRNPYFRHANDYENGICFMIWYFCNSTMAGEKCISVYLQKSTLYYRHVDIFYKTF